MFEFLRGTLVSCTPTQAVLEVQGVAYALEVSLTTSERLAAQGGEVVALVHHRLQDDRIRLFGFADEAERQLFRHLVSVAGIGPTHALALLSAAPAPDVWAAIRDGRWQLLAHTKGIGPKIAQRACNELGDRARKLALAPAVTAAPGTAASPTADPAQADLVEDAVTALLVLGYTETQARTAVTRSLKSEDAPTLQELIRAALRQS